MSFALYLIGYIIFIGGAAYARLARARAQVWIGVGVACLIGLAIAHGAIADAKQRPS
jgi:hypothetical protein